MVYSLSLCFPEQGLETGENSNKINCTLKIKQTSNQELPTQQKTSPVPKEKKMIKPEWKKGRETRNLQGWRDKRVGLGPQRRPTLAKFQISFQENHPGLKRKEKVVTFKEVRKRHSLG